MTQLTAPSLTDRLVDRLFERFSVMYGRHWAEMWADVPLADVRDAWAAELASFTGVQIGAALQRVGTFPPTLPEFVALCRPVPMIAAHRPYLPAPRSEPIDGAVRAEIVAGKLTKKRDSKAWAHAILEEAAAGTYRLPIGIAFAKEALGVDRE